MGFPTARLAGLLILCFLFSLPPAYCQIPSAPVIDGYVSGVTYGGGEFDHINLANGKLTVDIPLISYPQRGGALQLQYHLYLNSGPYFTLINKCPPDQCMLWGSTSTAMGVHLADSSSITNMTRANYYVPYPACKNGKEYYWSYAVASADGSTHLLGNQGTNYTVYNPGACVANVYGTGPYVALDGTGWRLNGDPSQSTLPWINRNGVIFTSSTTREDLNGNMITGNSDGSTTDTLGRIIPAIPTVGSASNTTTTGCVGPLPITYAYAWNPPGPAPSGQSTFKLCYASVSVYYNDGVDGDPILSKNVTLLQSVLLPNGQSWEFEYVNGGLGDLTKVTLPSGGTITYATAEGTVKSPVTSRTVDAADGTGPHTWTYTYKQNYPSPNTTIATDPLGNDTLHTFDPLLQLMYESRIDWYQGSSSTGTLLKSEIFTHQSCTPSLGVYPTQITTTWATSSATTEKTFAYDTPFSFSSYQGGPISGTCTFGKVTSATDYDYAPGSPGPALRTTSSSYIWQSSPNYLTAGLIDLKQSVITYDGSSNRVAETDFTYDNPSYLTASNISTQHQTAPGPVRGNLSTSAHWLNTTGGYLTSINNAYDTGVTYQSIDPLNHATSFSYSATFAGAFPTTVTNALSQSTTYNYDFNTGLMTSMTDPNQLQTIYAYDSFWRLTSVTNPDGGVDTIARQETTFPYSATLNKQINTSQTSSKTTIFDGMGRTWHAQLTSDPQGTDYTDTTYDALGRVATVSNPYRSGTDITSSPGTTTYGYDPLGRKIAETYADGSVLKTAYCGPSTLVTDPVGKWRRSRVDGLGRMVEVDEPNSPTASVASTGCPGSGEPIWVTSYTFDALGNVTKVLQNGSHQRTFTYDSLSRLLTSNNPEVGTITYAYNGDNTVATKKDARNITTTYSFDNIRREKTRTYSNGDPTVSTNYDETGCLTLSACQNIGHRTSMTDAAGSESWAYQTDAANHRSAHADKRTTSGITKTSTYYLDLAGNITQAVYPTGRTVNYTFDNADRPSTATDGSNGITYASGFDVSSGSTCSVDATCYTPQGTFYALAIGETSSFTGLNITHIYNSRLQPQEFKASSTGGNAIDVTYNFVDPVSGKNAGHLYSITNNLDTTRSQAFSYDQLNRIISAQTTSTHATSPAHCWAETYTLDAWANLQSIAQTNNSNYTGCSQESGFSTTADGNNHVLAFAYDASGNATSDGTYAYIWDGESQLKTANGVTYTYDGDGRRVSKTNGKLYWYGAGSEILAETGASGNTLNEYIFFGGKRVALLPAGGNAQYYVEDMLGSSRVVTTNTGVVCYDADFYPYGGERPYTNTCTQNNYKFEGKERDAETGNDDFGARYYSNRFGRWLSADWSAIPIAVPYANLTNPQTLNLYSMVADDPESFADLNGHYQMSPFDRPPTYLEQHAEQTEAEYDAQVAAENAAAQQTAQNQVHKCGFFCRLFGTGVHFKGSKQDVKELRKAWKQLMKSSHARKDLNTALKKNGVLTIRSANNDAYYNPSDNSINVDPTFHPTVQTTNGEQAAQTEIILGHELGHATGTKDDGPGHMNNVSQHENPIRHDLGLPDRTEY